MPKTFAWRLGVLATLLEPTRRRLYWYVAGESAAVSRDQAASAVGVSRAMAAFHLDKLVEAGLLRAHYRRLSGRTGRGAGRPSKLYRRSRRRFDVTLPARDHELLARLLTESVASTATAAPAGEVAHSFGRSLGVRARKRITGRVSPEGLVSCVHDVMADIGFEPTSTRPGVVLARNCPFDPVSRRFPDVVCYTALAILRGVVEGVGAERVDVSREEHFDRCCVVLNAPGPRSEAVHPPPSRAVS